ncbi:MAG TPA: DUF116 domain-containing protein [Ignavibacteriaceae bacterium]|nr:DUF116 domain-containing protein [Ignavibacteriaceae bacterium]
MKTITYNLKQNADNSDEFYAKLAIFTNEVVAKAEIDLKNIITDYKIYLIESGVKDIRSREEYIFDFLCLGAFWKVYNQKAYTTNLLAIKAAAFLYRTRNKNARLKPYSDKVRGILYQLFFLKEKHHKITLPELRNLRRFIVWLEAAGEFKEEVKRLQNILSFFKSLEYDVYEKYIGSILLFAGWFKYQAIENLGDYTIKVSDFLRTEKEKYAWREDIIFCGRKEVEYHLNLVGSEIMNLKFGNEFQHSSKKVVLLPACMINDKSTCKARKVDLDLDCIGCNKECRVNHYKQLGKSIGFEVKIIPHSSDFTGWLKRWAYNKDIAVVGVACTLNLIQGGLELKDLNIPAQCVFLDYCGCSNHWDEKGFATDINENKLIEIFTGKRLDKKNHNLLIKK